MATLIPVYTFGSKATDDLKALLHFYGVIMLALLLLLGLEAYFGMFDGLSVAQALLKATGMDVMSDEFVGML